MTEIRINHNLCRLCGCKNENGQSLSNDDDDDGGANELLFKVQETFSMLVSLRMMCLCSNLQQQQQKQKLLKPI